MGRIYKRDRLGRFARAAASKSGKRKKMPRVQTIRSHKGGITYETRLQRGLFGSTANTKAFKGEKFIGFADSNIRRKKSKFNNLYVIPEYRGKGIAKNIANRQVRGLKRYNRPIVLSTDRSDGGQKFFQRNKIAGVQVGTRGNRMSSADVTQVMDMLGQWEAQAHIADYRKAQRKKAKRRG